MKTISRKITCLIFLMFVMSLSGTLQLKAATNIQTENATVTVRMVGDILLHDGVNKACKTDDGYDYNVLFNNVRELIESADIAIVNQEVVIGGLELGVSGYPCFNAPYEVADALYNAGFDVICHGTNHALDKGKKGIINCLNNWRNKYPSVKVLGIYDNEMDYEEVYITEVKGIRIAILNYTYGTNGISMPSGMPYAVALLKEDKIMKDIAYAEENADFTIVCPHWGDEYRLSANSYQEKLAMQMTQMGADLIIGTHPHVIEPIEQIVASNGNTSICYYSIGNFVNWTSGRGKNISNRMIGGMSETIISKSNNRAYIKEYDVIPLVCHLEERQNGVTTYLLSDYTEELSLQNAIRKQDSNFSEEYCRELVDKIW